MTTETMLEFGDRVRATIEGWTEQQQRDRMRLIARWSGAAEEMFWAGQFGQEVTDEMRAAVREAGEAVLNA
jgi:hypothetical protein